MSEELSEELARLTSTFVTATSERQKAREQLEVYRRMVAARLDVLGVAEDKAAAAAMALREFIDLHYPAPAVAPPATVSTDPRAITVRTDQ